VSPPPLHDLDGSRGSDPLAPAQQESTPLPVVPTRVGMAANQSSVLPPVVAPGPVSGPAAVAERAPQAEWGEVHQEFDATEAYSGLDVSTATAPGSPSVSPPAPNPAVASSVLPQGDDSGVSRSVSRAEMMPDTANVVEPGSLPAHSAEADGFVETHVYREPHLDGTTVEFADVSPVRKTTSAQDGPQLIEGVAVPVRPPRVDSRVSPPVAPLQQPSNRSVDKSESTQAPVQITIGRVVIEWDDKPISQNRPQLPKGISMRRDRNKNR